MKSPLAVLPEAKEDIRSGHAFFERCWAGLGDEFAIEVFSALDSIADTPLASGEIDRGVRAKSVKRFGYVVYYRLHEDDVEVIAILHGARNPDEWLRRI